MKIRYIGHSCFVLTSASGTSVVTDPFGDIGFPMPHVHADAVSVSHGHYDHANIAAVEGRVLQNAGKYTVKDITASAQMSFHDDIGGAKRGTNLIFSFEIDGVRVLHLGDLGEPCTESRLSTLEGGQVLLIPVGGVYTIDARVAAEYVRKLKPSVVIPMHYQTEDLNFSLGDLQDFLDECADFCKIAQVGASVEITKDSLPKCGTQILVMERERP